jgi:hypothetical protein
MAGYLDRTFAIPTSFSATTNLVKQIYQPKNLLLFFEPPANVVPGAAAQTVW